MVKRREPLCQAKVRCTLGFATISSFGDIQQNAVVGVFLISIPH